MTPHPRGFIESFALLSPDLAGIRSAVARDPRHLTHSGAMFSVELGECTLLVGLTAWRIEDDTGVFLGSETPRELIAERIGLLDGRALTEVTPLSPGGEVIFDFSGIRLHVFPMYSGHLDDHEGVAVPDDNEHWGLCLPSGETIVAGPGARLGRSTTSQVRRIFEYWRSGEHGGA